MTTILNVILNNAVHVLVVAGSYAETQSCTNSSAVFVSLIIIPPPDECQNSADERHQEPSVILSLIIAPNTTVVTTAHGLSDKFINILGEAFQRVR
jgi:hypothetical protein